MGSVLGITLLLQSVTFVPELIWYLCCRHHHLTAVHVREAKKVFLFVVVNLCQVFCFFRDKGDSDMGDDGDRRE